ncbi:MAG TPA: hypothetical protein VEK08_11445 [Planctomycetota bacterium]|nr:hypothetical protein [Planctomycetota bacterium]
MAYSLTTTIIGMADPSAMIMGLIVLGIFILPLATGALALLLKHREKMATLKGGSQSSDPKLTARIEALEKKCEKLQEQVNEAHALLVDERRMLDQKLAQKLEATAAIPEDGVRAVRPPTQVKG